MSNKYEKAPNIWTLRNLMKDINGNSGTRRMLKNGEWVPARPNGLDTIPSRFKAAMMVFNGKADALIWPEDEE